MVARQQGKLIPLIGRKVLILHKQKKFAAELKTGLVNGYTLMLRTSMFVLIYKGLCFSVRELAVISMGIFMENIAIILV